MLPKLPFKFNLKGCSKAYTYTATRGTSSDDSIQLELNTHAGVVSVSEAIDRIDEGYWILKKEPTLILADSLLNKLMRFTMDTSACVTISNGVYEFYCDLNIDSRPAIAKTDKEAEDLMNAIITLEKAPHG